MDRPLSRQPMCRYCDHEDHVFTEVNTYTKPNGNRGCKECRRTRAREWARRNRAKAN